MTARFLRYQATTPTARGSFTGVFGLANGLARSGRLTEAEWRWWRAANDRFDAAYPNPARTDSALFDKTVHPVTSCWFRATATALLDGIPGYLQLLDRYGVGWHRLESDDPGRVLYSDDYQVVVVPYPNASTPPSSVW